MFRKRGFVFGVLILFSLGMICAAAVENSLHLTIQTTNATGVTTGTFDFVFNISNSSDCSNVVYSNAATLSTDNRGIISYYLEDVILDFSVQYWLCYYRDAVLINATKLARTPYSFSLGGSTSSAIPTGMIAPFNLTECPTGWTLANGSNGTPDLRGIFIRGSGTNSILNYANGTDISATQGSYKNDSFQGFALSDTTTGQLKRYSIGNPLDDDAASVATVELGGGLTGAVLPTANDGTNGIPRTGVETSPAYYSTIYCVKTTEDSATSNSIWGVSGNYISVQNTSRNVGIGTSVPSTKLHVVGSVNITGNISIGAGTIWYNDSANKYYYYNTTSWVEIGSGASSGNSSNYINPIVESGNNSNGSYIKFIDGTMVAWGNLTLNGYPTNITFPVPFSDTSYSFVSQFYGSSASRVVNERILSRNVSGTAVWVYHTVGTEVQVTSGDISWTAIGRWTNTPYNTSTITVGGGIPSGAIVPFNRTSCPVGWTLADGSSGTPDLRGIFIRGSGTNSILNYANGTDISATQGSYKNDSFQGHWHNTQRPPWFSTELVAGSAIYAENTITYALVNSGGSVRDASTDSISGTPRTGNETTPAYYSTIYCVKMTEDTTDSNTIWASSGNNVLLSNSSMNVNISSNLTITGQGSTINQSAWIAPTFNNSWVNYGSIFSVAGYMKDSMGFVHLQGLVKSGTIGQCIFTLPAGYRPQYQEIHIVQTSSDTYGRLDITTTGCVQASVGSNTWFSLDGVTFRAYQ